MWFIYRLYAQPAAYVNRPAVKHAKGYVQYRQQKPRSSLCLARGTELPCEWIDHLLGRGLSGSILRDQLDRAGERIRPVVIRGEREVDELLDQLRILPVPGVEELQLTVRVVRLDALDPCGLAGPGMPDELIGNGDPGSSLAFSEHELEVREFGIGLRLPERVRFNAHDLVGEEAVELDELLDELRLGRVREIAPEDRPPVILHEHRNDRGKISHAERRVAEGERLRLFQVDRRRRYCVHEFEL